MGVIRLEDMASTMRQSRDSNWADVRSLLNAGLARGHWMLTSP